MDTSSSHAADRRVLPTDQLAGILGMHVYVYVDVLNQIAAQSSMVGPLIDSGLASSYI